MNSFTQQQKVCLAKAADRAMSSHLVTSQQIMEKTECAAELMESECLDVKKSLERLLAKERLLDQE
jgi:hypothetical protein